MHVTRRNERVVSTDIGVRKIRIIIFYNIYEFFSCLNFENN